MVRIVNHSPSPPGSPTYSTTPSLQGSRPLPEPFPPRNTKAVTKDGNRRMMPKPATPEQNAAYRAGICVDCGERSHSAGRPRCEDCHAVYWAALTDSK